MRALCLLWILLVGWLQAGGLTFEKTLIDVHLTADGTTATSDFSFENKTDKPVTIARVDKTCSCLGAEVKGGKLCYQPGEKGVIRVAFELGNFAGVVDKSVVLWLDKDPAERPSATLTVRVHIPVLVEMSEKTLKWTLGGAPEPQRIDIRMKHDKPIRILKTSSSSEAFKVALKTLEEGRHYELWVTPLAADQAGISVIRIETDCEVARHKTQQAFAVVRRSMPGEGAAKR